MRDALTMANVATESNDYKFVKQRWALPRLLLGGTDAIHDNPHEILPRFPGEDLTDYNRRIENTTLTNVFGKTVDLMSCAPFSRSVKFSPDADERVVGVDDDGGWARDVDRQGTDTATFAKQLLHDLLTYGKCHIYVDFPDAQTQGMTLADQDRANIRPYFRRISPWDLFAWDVQIIGGSEHINELRWHESRVERSGFEEKTIAVIRRVMRDKVELWEKPPSSGDWLLMETLEPRIAGRPLDRIPMVTVYANRVAPLTSLPPLENLAYLNRKHLRTDSELTRLIHTTCSPFLVAPGSTDVELKGLVVGPSTLLSLGNPDATIRWVEHSGQQITIVQNNLDSTLMAMEGMAMDLVSKKISGGVTATEKAINTAEQTSELQEMTRNLATGIDQAFRFAMVWEGETRAEEMLIGTKINDDFGLVFRSEADIKSLTELYVQGAITLETLLAEVKGRGLLRDTLDIDEEAAAVRALSELTEPSNLE